MFFMLIVKLNLFFSIKPRLDQNRMHKFLILLFLSMFSSYAYGQTDSLTKEETRLLDSMFNNDEFIKLMMKKPGSYVDVNIGIGNRTFSVKNNALNAGQAQTDKLYFTPAVAYYHKSGAAFSATAYSTTDSGKLYLYQFAISPSYTYSNKKFKASVSYTRFIESSTGNFNISPFKNDFYVSGLYKKTWIQPGLAFGFSFGKQKEYFDTSFWFVDRIVHLGDTITTKVSGLSLTLSATHEWNFYGLINKKDAIQLRPTILLNAGAQKWDISHSNSFFNRRVIVQNYLKRRFGDGTAAEKFNLQSLAFSADLIYYYGKFYLQPQLYLDYYLPTTTEKRLTSLFTITAGFSFY